MQQTPRCQRAAQPDRSRDSVAALSVFLTNLTSKIAACAFLSSFDSHERRTYPEVSILARTDRSLLLLDSEVALPSMADATDSSFLESASAVSSRESVVASSAFLTKLHFKDCCMCKFAIFFA